jgi:hypothetical protein
MYTKYKFNELTLTATNYNREVTVKLPQDSNLDELFDAFQTIVKGLGYSETGLKDIICEWAELHNRHAAEEQKIEEELRERIKKLEVENLSLQKYHEYDYVRISNNLAMEA